MESMVQEVHDETSSFHMYRSRLIGLGWDEEQPSTLLTTDLIETSNKSLRSQWLGFGNKTSFDFTRRQHQPLKTLSLICQRWRHILLPDVFRCSRVALSRQPRWVCLCSSLEDEIRKIGDLYSSERATDLFHKFQSRIATSPSRPIVCNNPHKPMGLEYVENDDSDLLSLPDEYLHWLSSVRGEVEMFVEFVKDKGLQADIKSLVLQTDQEITSHPTAIEQKIIAREVNLMLETLLETFSLGRLVIAAPPSTMAALTSTRDSPETWAFDMPLHYLSFSIDGWKTKRLADCSDSSCSNAPSTHQKPVQPRPHNLLPWTQITYNEGTMLPGYAHYEWNFNRPSFLLPTLLNLIHREPSHNRTPKITSSTYISNFPFANHVKDIADQFANFKWLREVKVKFAEMDFLDDGDGRLGRGQMSDVWKEWEDSYKNIIRYFLLNAAPGTVVECLDTVHTRLFEDVDKIMKDSSLIKAGPMIGQSFLQTEISGEEESGRGRWGKRDVEGLR